MLNIYKTKDMTKLNKEDKEFNPNYSQHELHLKHMLFCGGTGLGKSNAVINLISQMSQGSRGTYANIQIYTGDPEEKLYRMLKSKLGDKLTLENIDLIPRLDDNKVAGQTLLIIDDFITSSKKVLNICEEYAIRSRKRGFQVCYLTQSFYACPIKIRQQVRYIALFKIPDKRNFNSIVSTIDTDIPADIIKQVVKNATQHELNLCLIDLQNRDINKTFRRNFGLDYYQFEDENGNKRMPLLFEGSGIIN